MFANQDSEGRGSLSAAEVCAALRVCTGRTVHPSDCRALMAQIREVTELPVGAPDGRLSFEDFCLLVAELQSSGRRGGRSGRHSPSVLSRTAEMMHQLLTPFTRVAEWVLPQRLARQLSNGNSGSASDVRDVYLGGTLTNTSWRENIAIPILK